MQIKKAGVLDTIVLAQPYLRGPLNCPVRAHPVFRDINLLSPEHGINPRAQADRFRQIEEQS